MNNSISNAKNTNVYIYFEVVCIHVPLGCKS